MDIHAEVLKQWCRNLTNSTVKKELKPKKRFKWDQSINSVLSPNVVPPPIVEYSSVYDYCDNSKQSKLKKIDEGDSLHKTKSNCILSDGDKPNLEKTKPNSKVNFGQCNNLEKHKFTSSQSDNLRKRKFTSDQCNNLQKPNFVGLPLTLEKSDNLVNYVCTSDQSDSLVNHVFTSDQSDSSEKPKCKPISDQFNRLQNSEPICSSNQTRDIITQIQRRESDKSKPHFPITVEELSLVTSVNNWTNTNIRVCGIVLDVSDESKYYLESVEEEEGPFKVLLDIECLPTVPLLDRVLQLFAQLYIVDSQPVLRVLFYRDFSNVNLHRFRQAEEIFKSYVPIFIKRQSSKQDSENKLSQTNESFPSMMNSTLDNFSFSDLID